MDLLKSLNEERVVTNVRLTSHQQRILAIMMNDPDGSAHDEDISMDRNMAGARQVLAKLGIIQPSHDDVFVVTDKGREIADEEGITDGGQLTDKGKELASSVNATPPPSMGNPGPGGPSDDPPPPREAAAVSTEGGLPESVQPRLTFTDFLVGQSLPHLAELVSDGVA